MSVSIEAVFEKGIFRPLKPIALPENQRVNLVIADLNECSEIPPQLLPTKYPDDYLEDCDDTYDYQPVPPVIVGTVKATFVDGGVWTPPVYPEEQD